MNIHKHARLTPRGRALLVQRIEWGLRVEDAAQAAGVSVRTAYKWLRRFREEGEAGLQDRSSRPKSCPHATSEALVARLVEQRRARKTYRQIANDLGLAVSTVARRLRKLGLHRLAEWEPAPPVVRYEYAHPRDLLHLDIKKLGRFRKPGHRVTGDRQQSSAGAGWEFVHVAIDDASRIAFSSLHPDERGASACQALLQALRYYRGLGVRVTRIMTDNGVCYRSKRFRGLVRRLGLRHLWTKPYTLRTNGKAERFIQTSLREWAYARSYDSSAQRAAHLLPWLHHYNWHRPHSSLGYQPPISRAPLPLNNVLVYTPRARHHDLIWKEELLAVFPEWRNDMRKLDLTRRLTRALLEGLAMSRDLWKDPATEWTLLSFIADIVRKLRTDELSFPSVEDLEVFKKPALAIINKKTRVAKPRGVRSARRKD